MIVAVLDASALLAMLRGEPGGDRVKEVLPDAAISAINFAEVVGHYARNGAPEGDIRSLLSALPLACVAVDERLSYDIGLLLPTTRSAGLSLGDRACLALARRYAALALTADRNWKTVVEAAKVEVELIR